MKAQTPENNSPKLRNAMWPGLVGKGSPGAEPIIGLDTMLQLTAAADVDGRKFDGVDLFLFDPHVSIDSTKDDLKRLADKISGFDLEVGSLVAPVWPPTGGGPALGSAKDRKNFVRQVEKACRIGQTLRQLGIRKSGIIRIDSACSVTEWNADPKRNQARIASTFREACTVAESFGERLAAEGEICWGGMHSWRKMVDLLERVDRPKILGFQADMAHTLLYVMGYNAPEDAILPANYDWADPGPLDAALQQLTDALGPWTIDFHVAQNDGTVFGSGTHDKTGHHCLPKDPNGKLDIARHSGFWLRSHDAKTSPIQHICWDGCMFPNAVMMEPQTWNDVLAAMISVRDAHGTSAAPADSTPAKARKSGKKISGRTKKPKTKHVASKRVWDNQTKPMATKKPAAAAKKPAAKKKAAKGKK